MSGRVWRLDGKTEGKRRYFPATAVFGSALRNRVVVFIFVLMESRMNQYMALTSNDSATPALFIDTTVPLEILLDAASYRLQAVTQVMENLALRSEISSDAVVLSDFALLCSIPLRDGCDLLDVIARRMDMPRI
jgi:hypothetical protein